MPITRRKRATPPDQPESAQNNHVADQAEAGQEAPIQAVPTEQEAAPTPPAPAASATPATPAEAEGPTTPATPAANVGRPESAPYQPLLTNGERFERQEYTPSIEGGRRTARGELFRRPPQPPPTPVVVPPAAPALQPPSHEIKLPLGKEPGDANGDPLHLSYNPGYTGSDEVRSSLLHQLAQESKSGGRARCWNCGSLAIVYDRWNTRSKTFGEIGIAYCEICGVWSVM